MIGAFLPGQPRFQRGSAETRSDGAGYLARTKLCASFNPVHSGSMVSLCADEDHTPSPPGQCTRLSRVLPLFTWNEAFGRGATALRACRSFRDTFRFGFADQSNKGTQRCPSNMSFSASSPVQALRPVVTHWANKRLAAQPSGQGQQQSRAARLRRVPRLARRETSPFASLTPANVTNDLTISRAPLGRATRFSGPAQYQLSRGFRAYFKIQEGIPCSTKS